MKEIEANTPRILTYYRHSDEKLLLRKRLDQILANKRFKRVMDLGAGMGEASLPLYARTERYEIVEKSPYYESILKKKFPNATIHVKSLNDFEFQSYDAILYSHGLYYQPAESWLHLCKRLLTFLNPDGILILVMNADRGDWWTVVQPFLSSVPALLGFHYRPWSDFRKELSSIAEVEATAFDYTLKFFSLEEIISYTIKACLSLKEVSPENEKIVEALYSQLLKDRQGMELRYESEIVVLRRCFKPRDLKALSLNIL
jgi:SAM-dependent methyltransferase